jgi:hypothetical protein
MAAMAYDRRLACCLHSPALRSLFIGRFMQGWREAEQERQAARYQADLERLKAALEALE